MSIATDIKNGNISNVYLIYGEEAYKRKVFRDMLVKNIPYGDVINYSYYEGRDIKFSQVYENAVTAPLFAQYRLVVVENSQKFQIKKKTSGQAGTQSGSETGLEDGDNAQKNADAWLEKIIDEIPLTTVLVFVEEQAAKNKKIYKKIAQKGIVQECKSDSDAEVIKWIKKGFASSKKDIENDAAQLLFLRVGNDYTKLRQEIEKLIGYAGKEKTVTADDVAAAASLDIESKVFDMLREMSRKNIKGVMDKYYDLLANREHPLMILAMIRKQFRIMLQSQELFSKGAQVSEIAQAAKSRDFVIRNSLDYMRRSYTCHRVIEILESINDTDLGIKNGNIDAQIGVEILLINITQ